MRDYRPPLVGYVLARCKARRYHGRRCSILSPKAKRNFSISANAANQGETGKLAEKEKDVYEFATTRSAMQAH